MGEVIEIIPGLDGIKAEVASLRKMRASVARRDLYIYDAAGADVTQREIGLMTVTLDLLDKALAGLPGMRKKHRAPTIR